MPREKKSPHPFDVALGSAIRSARVRRRMTREVLAQRTAIPLSNLRRREDGLNETTVSELARIAAVLDIPTREMVEMALADYNGDGNSEDGLRKLVASVSEATPTVEDNVTYIGKVRPSERDAAYTDEPPQPKD